MARQIDATTLDGAAKHYAAAFMRPDVRNGFDRFVDGPSYVIQDFYNFTYKDEFSQLLAGVKEWMGRAAVAEFDRLASAKFAPRDDAVFHQLLADNLAINPEGAHIAGKIGKVQIGSRRIGEGMIEVEHPASLRFRKWAKLRGVNAGERQTIQRLNQLYWPVYAGEAEERQAGSDVPDPLPAGADPFPVEILQALNTRISNEAALGACDFVVDRLDEGTGAAILQGRSGAQPADPDTAVSGTLLFTLVYSDPAFGSAVDANPGGRATASAITSDSSADATGTLGYCRASASNDGATSLDDHIDGEAGTSGADFNFNTLSIVSGATVSMTSHTVTMPEG